MREKSGSWSKLEIAIAIIAVMMAIYQMVSAEWLFENTLEFMNNHLGFGLVLVFLGSMRAKKKWRFLYLSFAILSLITTGYVKIFFNELQWRFSFPTDVDVVFDILLIMLSLEAAREKFGLVIPGMAVLFVAYTFLTPYLPPPLYHPVGTPRQILAMYTTSFSGSGIYGLPLSVSANYIFLFLLFGGLLQMSGATSFFMEVAKLVSGKLRGGPAQMAVISSAMCATVTGSAMANVMITGSFTIPAMKRMGFEPATAGAVEAVASTGGLITPPVMGATAFLMSAFTGIPYVQVMAAAALPALFYYVSCFIYVELYARKINLPPMSADINRNTIIRGGPAFFIPMAVIVALLVMGFSPIHTAAWAVISTFVVFLVTNAIIRDIPVRRQFRLLLDGTVDGANSGAGIAVVCAVLGLMMGMLTMTGMGVQITRLVADWSYGSLFLAALITMVVCLFLGCIVVGTVGYVLTAMLAAPVLLKMGVSPLQVHMFLLFFTAYASFTPPVATAAIAAAAVSGAPYLKVGIRSWTIAMGLFTFPFIFLWNQTLLLNPPDPLTGVLTIMALTIGLVALNMATTGYSLGRIGWLPRLLFALCFAGFLTYTITLNYILLGTAFLLFPLLIIWGWSRVRNAKAVPLALEKSI